MMSNHYHVVLYVDAWIAKSWSDWEVLKRWTKLFDGPPLVQYFFAGKILDKTEPERMDKLMGILALAFTWCLIAGHWHCGDVKCLPLNKHYRPARALFREGLDLLRGVLLNDEAKGEAISFLVLLKFCPVHR